jgi:hypothetical protein
MNPFSKKFVLIVNVQNATGRCIPNKIRQYNKLPKKFSLQELTLFMEHQLCNFHCKKQTERG